MKGFLLSAFLMLRVFHTVAQEEVYFNDTRLERKDIRVKKTVQGVYLNTDFLAWTINKYGKTSYLDMAYFREDRIAPTWVLHTAIGLNHFTDWRREVYDSDKWDHIITEEDLNRPIKPYYSLSIQAEVAPRWYFSHRPRYIRNRRTELNSGWFVAIPLQLSANLLRQPMYSSDRWLPDHFSILLDIWAQLGFRYAFTSHFLIEISVSYTPFYAHLPFISDSRRGWGGYGKWHEKGDEFTEHFKLEFKAAYVF